MVIPIKPNMNFEDVPQPKITEQMVANVAEVASLQDAHHGKALDHKDHYDWMELALENITDGLKFIQCEINRKNDVIALLESALRVDQKYTSNQPLNN